MMCPQCARPSIRYSENGEVLRCVNNHWWYREQTMWERLKYAVMGG